MKEQFQTLSQEKTRSQQKTSEKQSVNSNCCANCGTPFHSGDKFCEECGDTAAKKQTCGKSSRGMCFIISNWQHGL